MNLVVKQSYAVAIAIMLFGHQTAMGDYGYGVIDFGAQNSALVQDKIKQIAANENTVLNISQVGEMHTSTEYFIGPLRDFMQHKFGNAGIGWVTPEAYHRTQKWDEYQWDTIGAKNDHFITRLKFTTSKWRHTLWNVRTILKASDEIDMHDTSGPVSILEKSLKNDNKMIKAVTTVPFTIQTNQMNAVQGLWLQRKNHAGAIVSSFNVNQDDWKLGLEVANSDLVIVEYGTKDVFAERLDAQKFRNGLKKHIREIKAILPNATILLMSPPDLLVSSNLARPKCYEQIPTSYDKVKMIQISVAKSEKLLYWDWQKSMGGNCNIANWHVEGLAEKDYVNLTPLGYEISAEMLSRAIIKYLNAPPTQIR